MEPEQEQVSEQKEEEQMTMLEKVFALFGMPSAFADEEESGNEGAVVASVVFDLRMRASSDTIYWNPDPDGFVNETGDPIVAGGDDNYDGEAADRPVLSFSVALEKAGVTKKIVNMGVYDVYEDGEYTGSGTLVINYFVEEDEEGESHNGNIFSVKHGATLTLSGFTVRYHTEAEEAVKRVMELSGGKLVLGEGMNIPAQIYLEDPSEELLPIKITAEKVDKPFIIGFDSSYSGIVGVMEGDDTSRIELSETLQGSGWVLFTKDGNTYAHVPPKYKAIYIDGENGNDTDNPGNTPLRAVKTFERAKELLAQNSETCSVIYVVNTVTIDKNDIYELASVSDTAKVVRFVGNEEYSVPCSGPMFKVVGCEPVFDFPIDGVNSDSELIQVNGDSSVLTLNSKADISGANGYAIVVGEGGMLNANGARIVSGGAVNAEKNTTVNLYGGAHLEATAEDKCALVADDLVSNDTEFVTAGENDIAVQILGTGAETNRSVSITGGSMVGNVSVGNKVELNISVSGVGNIDARMNTHGKIGISGGTVESVDAACDTAISGGSVTNVETTGALSISGNSTVVGDAVCGGIATVSGGTVTTLTCNVDPVEGDAVTVSGGEVGSISIKTTGSVSVSGNKSVVGTIGSADARAKTIQVSGGTVTDAYSAGDVQVTGGTVTKIDSKGDVTLDATKAAISSETITAAGAVSVTGTSYAAAVGTITTTGEVSVSGTSKAATVGTINADSAKVTVDGTGAQAKVTEINTTGEVSVSGGNSVVGTVGSSSARASNVSVAMNVCIRTIRSRRLQRLCRSLMHSVSRIATSGCISMSFPMTERLFCRIMIRWSRA